MKSNAIRLGIPITLALVASFWLRVQPADIGEREEFRRSGYGSDAATYWDLATNILQARGFVDSPELNEIQRPPQNTRYYPNLTRGPGYPIALAISRLVYDDYAVAIWLNVISFIFIIFYADRLFRLSSTYVWFLAWSPVYLIYNQGLLSDVFCGCLIIGFVYHFVKVSQSAASGKPLDFKHAVMTFLTGGTALLTKSYTIAFIFPFCVIFLASSVVRIQKSPRSRLLHFTLPLLLVTAMPLMFWCARNFSITGRFTPAVFSGKNLFLNYIYFKEPDDSKFGVWKSKARADFVEKKLDEGLDPTTIEVLLDEKLTAVTKNYISENPQHAVRTTLGNVAGLFLISYFKIEDLIFAKLFNLNLREHYYILNQDIPITGPWRVIHGWLGLLRLVFQWILLICFFGAAAVILISAKRQVFPVNIEPAVQACTVASAAFVSFTGIFATTDRLLIPVYPFVAMSVFLAIRVIIRFLLLSRSKLLSRMYCRG
jgi:hypothetical protein